MKTTSWKKIGNTSKEKRFLDFCEQLKQKWEGDDELGRFCENGRQEMVSQLSLNHPKKIKRYVQSVF